MSKSGSAETIGDKVDRLEAEIKQTNARLDQLEGPIKDVIKSHNSLVDKFSEMEEGQKEILKVLNETRTNPPQGRAPGGRVSTLEALEKVNWDGVADSVAKMTNTIVDIVSKVRAPPPDPLGDIASVLYKSEIKGVFRERIISSKYLPTEERNNLLEKIKVL
jgi:hypothetical protein